LVGENNAAALALGKFPLLIKLLDANRWLSVQVHPKDDYALRHEGEFGKTEMWVVLHAEPGAELIYGFRRGVTRDAYAAVLGTERSADDLHRVAVQAGDVIFVPAGAIHALGPGIIVAEIQQNSDTTYRIYDWGRPRPLHLEQALDVLDFTWWSRGRRRPDCSWKRMTCASSNWLPAPTSRRNASCCPRAASILGCATARPSRSGGCCKATSPWTPMRRRWR
jgi:mannose-6-phosphate isomerase